MQELTELQDHLTAVWHQKPSVLSENSDLKALVQNNHYYNYNLWHAEDEARRTDTTDSYIVEAKRQIDSFNQLRNNHIEKIDLFLHNEFQQSWTLQAPLHTETPGMMLDRLSILALKKYHMTLQAKRSTATDEHRANCKRKLATIAQQQTDLHELLEKLWEEFSDGQKAFKLYLQMKMYNDRDLNPALYKGH